MADLVLDTHACLFALAAPRKLGRRARAAVARPPRSGRIWIPAAVVAEVVMLKELGRSELGLPELRTAFEVSPSWGFLPLDFDQLDEFAGLTAIRDPFDRLIVSAARHVGAKLVTKDASLGRLGLVEIVWG